MSRALIAYAGVPIMDHLSVRVRRPAAVAVRALVMLVASGVALGCAASERSARPTVPSVRSLYPLAVGDAWSYDVDTGEGARVLAITRVIGIRAGVAEVVTGQTSTRYELRPNGIWRVERGGYLLKSPIAIGASWMSGGDMTATITRTDIGVETTAGRFARCIEVRETGAASGAVIHTTYCPDVGPVLVRTETTLSHATVRVEARLRGYEVIPHSGNGSGPID